MNKEILQKVLKTESLSFSYEEIQKMLDEELEKSPDEMDTQFIDLCVDVLSKKEVSEEKVVKKYKKTSPKKLLLVAAVICILAVLAIPVTAEIPAIESQGGIIKVLENYISVNFTDGKKYNLSFEVRDYEIPDYIIPDMFYESSCVITDVGPAGDNSYQFGFELPNLDSDGYIGIAKFSEEFAFGYDYANIYVEVEQLEQFTVNGINVLVFSSVDNYVQAEYCVECYKVSICFNNLKFAQVVEIIENHLTETFSDAAVIN